MDTDTRDDSPRLTASESRLLAWVRANGIPTAVRAFARRLSWGGWEVIAFTDLETAKAARLQVSAHDTVDGVVHLVTDPQTLTQLVDALERDAAERLVEA